MDEFEDRLLTCEDCGAQFLFSAKEQAYYRERGFQHPPKRCRQCREARRMAREGQAGRPGAPIGRPPAGLGRAGGDGSAVPETAGPDGMPQSPRYQRAAYMETSTPAGGHLQQRGRERFTVTCSECGAQTSVPFKPDPNRPVYCRSCYVARRGGPKPENR